MEVEPRSAKGRRTRARLLEAGKAVFERDGFLQARISDIAAEAKVSHGSFYHYFDSKESLFREIAEEVEVRLVSMDDIPPGGEDGPVERIRAANRAYLTAYKKEARIMRVIEEVSRYNDDVRLVRAKRDDYLAARLESAIRRLQGEGLADRRIDERYAATALGGMVAKFAEMMFIGGARFELEEAVEQLTILWANALGLREETVRRPVRARKATARPSASEAVRSG
jgi:AcrR family transcriptional regulator